jgi:CTP:molybdopterin cytidylyltransferase MocA
VQLADSKRLAVAVLAAGASRRFGAADKLIADLRGEPLGLHAVRAIPQELFAIRFVIASTSDHPLTPRWRASGFDVHENPDASQGMGTSVALAARQAIAAQADALLIALADMPFVPRDHFAALVDVCTSDDSVVCSSDGHARMPPAIFGKNVLPSLSTLDADTGARLLLQDAKALTCSPAWLIDIDTPEALHSLK